MVDDPGGLAGGRGRPRAPAGPSARSVSRDASPDAGAAEAVETAGAVDAADAAVASEAVASAAPMDARAARMAELIAEGCRVVSRRRFARAMRLFEGQSLLRVIGQDVPLGLRDHAEAFKAAREASGDEPIEDP